jgi:hypothetical protein
MVTHRSPSIARLMETPAGGPTERMHARRDAVR